MVGAYSCLLMSTLLGLVIPWLIKEVIDRGLSGRDTAVLVGAAVAIVVITAIKGGFSFGEGYLSEYISQGVAYDLRNALYDHLQRLSFSYHDRAQTGDLMSRTTSDVDSVRMFLNMGLVNAVNVLVMFIPISVILFSMNWRLTLVSLACMPFLALRAVATARRLRPLFMMVQKQFAAMSTVLQENIAGVRVVRAFAREEYVIDRFSQENGRLRDEYLVAARQWALNFPLMAFLINLSVAIVLWYGGRETIAGRLTVGELVAFNGYLVMLAWPVRTLGWVVNLVARAMSSGERLFQVLDAQSEVQEDPQAVALPPVQGHVRFEGVSFGYESHDPVLKNVDLEAKRGEVIALIGRTGGGKSTLVNLIPRFYDVTEGRITIDGFDIRKVTLSSLRRQIGVVLQDTFLFSTTIRENIAYGADGASMEEIVAAAKAAHAHEFIEELPQGYETAIGERGINLSGGQRQRIAIARALLLDPPILIMDDSTSSVDMETEYRIQQALATLMRDRTTFIIAHRLNTVKRADQILVIEDGEIVERGRHQKLLAQEGTYREIYNVQLRDQEELAASVARGEGAR